MAFTFGQKIKTLVKLFSEPRVLSALLSQRDFGFLKDVGWFESFLSQKSIDIKGNPIPWFTYSSIDFLDSRITNDLTLFEFGSGNSTLFFSKKVKKDISVEHNKEWYDFINKIKPSNVELVLTKSDSVNDYLSYFNNLKDKLDIIIVDGLHRNECLINAIDKLSNKGIVILDDSERIEYKPGIDFLLSNEFKSLEFWGISPGYLYRKATTIFYKTENCLKI